MADKRLLVIEDHSDVAELLVTYFQALDFEVYHADTGESGIEMARLKFPQLILLDVGLPDIDGYEVCTRLRQAALTRYVPIIFLTQRDERANKVKGLELGADDYVTKPFDLDELRLRVQTAVRRASADNLHEARTGLPTATLVEEELLRRESEHQAYADIRLILSGYNAYKDVYGFLAANDVFGFAARTIQDVISEKGTPDDFIGVLGDEFVVLTTAADPQAVSSEIIERFRAGVTAFYHFHDVERGGVLLNPGAATERFVPIMDMVQVAAETE